MPYIKQEKKAQAELRASLDPGELNWKLTECCIDYIKMNGLNYQKLNDVIGALESCKLEFYRRVVAPYEEKKIQANGDVY